MYTIAVDAMGGDFAPEVPAQGCLKALETYPDLSILLVGQREKLNPLLGDGHARLSVVDASDVISNHEAPVLAIRSKPDSSLVRAYTLVREGQAEALVSAGSTGAVLAGAMFRLGRMEGVERPALAVPIPTVGQPTLLLDIGANVDCLPEYLAQFAAMGSLYAERVMGRENPRVALVNIGEEAEKGNAQTKAAHALMAAEGQPYRFIGNVEARGIPLFETDVAVCDGFTGNILMKSMEGIIKAIFTMLKQELMSSTRLKMAGLLAKPGFDRLKQRMNADEVGGALLLGVRNAVVKAHGNSNAHAFFSALRQTRAMLESKVIPTIAEAILHLQS
ncbi:MAG TPA: phosphate acyltransferase PlsX [Clostridia bacterium]|nr:phosphate acyltransferase PlsX [Clostridia bacterium]